SPQARFHHRTPTMGALVRRGLAASSGAVWHLRVRRRTALAPFWTSACSSSMDEGYPPSSALPLRPDKRCSDRGSQDPPLSTEGIPDPSSRLPRHSRPTAEPRPKLPDLPDCGAGRHNLGFLDFGLPMFCRA